MEVGEWRVVAREEGSNEEEARMEARKIRHGTATERARPRLHAAHAHGAITKEKGQGRI